MPARLYWYGDAVTATVEDHIGRRVQLAAREVRDYAREKLSVSYKSAGFKAGKRRKRKPLGALGAARAAIGKAIKEAGGG